MKETALILRGVDSYDELKPWGIELAKKIQDASLIIFIGKNGRPRIVKSRDPYELEYMDLEE